MGVHDSIYVVLWKFLNNAEKMAGEKSRKLAC